MIVEERAHDVRCCGPEGCGLKHRDDRWCFGAECAGWRWVSVPNPAYDPTVHAQVYPGPRQPPSHIKSDVEGYCGLAGRP